MKTQDILVGQTFHDGKSGLRKVIAIGGVASDLQVHYVLLAAKTEREHVPGAGYKSIVGETSTCKLVSFAAWARSGHDEGSAQGVLCHLRAAKTKLSPNEDEFMASIRSEAGLVGPGTLVGYESRESRTVTALAKKGLLVRHDGEIELTLLGQAKLRLMGN